MYMSCMYVTVNKLNAIFFKKTTILVIVQLYTFTCLKFKTYKMAKNNSSHTGQRFSRRQTTISYFQNFMFVTRIITFTIRYEGSCVHHIFYFLLLVLYLINIHSIHLIIDIPTLFDVDASLFALPPYYSKDQPHSSPTVWKICWR